MAEVFGSIGNEHVELNNAATEATLKLLVAATLASGKKEKDDLKKLVSMAGINSDAWNEANEHVQKTAPLMERLGAASRELEPAFRHLQTVAGAYGTAVSALISGSNNMSDVLNAFKVLPGPLGAIAGTFGTLLKLQEEQFESYKKLTNAGINLGGNLDLIRASASRMGLSMDQLSSIAVKNSEAISKLGGGSDSAMKSFINLSTQMNSSQTGFHLRALGYTTEQINENMLQYLSMTGGRTSKEMQNTGKLIASTGEYLEQLDGLARITGKNRQEQQDALAEASKNAAFQAKLLTMSEEEKKKATEGMAQALALGGKGAVDAFQSKLMGVAPDKAGAMFEATASRTAAVVSSIVDQVNDKSKKSLDTTANMINGMRASQADMSKYGKETLFAIIRQGGPLADSLQQMGVTANKAATMTDAQIADALKRAEVDKSTAASAVERERYMQRMRDQLISTLSQFTVTFMPEIMRSIKFFADSITWLTSAAIKNKDQIVEWTKWIVKAWVVMKAFSAVVATIRAVEAFRGTLGTPGRPMHVVGPGIGGGGTGTPPPGGPAEKGGKGSRIGKYGVGAVGLGIVGSVAGAAGADKLGAFANIGSDALAGAALGAAIPGLNLTGIPEIVGGLLGAGVGLYNNWGTFFADSKKDLKAEKEAKEKAEKNQEDTTTLPVTGDPDPSEKLITAVETLNNHMVDLKRFMLQTANNTKNTVAEIHHLSGDLYPRP
jgi:hypothetical protein